MFYTLGNREILIYYLISIIPLIRISWQDYKTGLFDTRFLSYLSGTFTVFILLFGDITLLKFAICIVSVIITSIVCAKFGFTNADLILIGWSFNSLFWLMPRYLYYYIIMLLIISLYFFIYLYKIKHITKVRATPYLAALWFATGGIWYILMTSR